MTNDEYIANLKNLSNKELINNLEYCGHDGYYNILYYPIVDEIKRRLSSKGEWKPSTDDSSYWICSECGFVSEAFSANILYHFCPNCGADMRGENEP